MYQGDTIAAVIPAYNEESFVGEVIETLPSFVDRAYVVDDCSTDDTWEEITQHASAVNGGDPPQAPLPDGGTDRGTQVVPIQHDQNRGVGGAIKTGYQRALDDDMDVTVVVSGDGQSEPDIVERVLQPVVDGEAGYAKGNRLRGEDREAMPRFRRVGNFALTFLTKISSGYWRSMDPQNGSTAISQEALSTVDIEEMYEDYGYCNHLLAMLNAENVTVADVPHRAVYDDEESHIQYRTYVPRVSSLLLRNFVGRLRSKYMGREFHPLPLFYLFGAAGSAAGLLALAKRALDGDEGGVVAPLALIVLGVFGMLAAAVLDFEENRDLTVRTEER
ncbi:glycosyltransferase family 2 protein [Haloarchaeobius baliensis]|uniref:glycosyltransferase family 2 protein n=1 Tax=Haloarchaeobius baliensis TaxID=1670458 RepID=UPI003F8817DC